MFKHQGIRETVMEFSLKNYTLVEKSHHCSDGSKGQKPSQMHKWGSSKTVYEVNIEYNTFN